MRDDGLVWEKVSSEYGPELILFRARYDYMRHPQSSETFKRLVLEADDWVNVVAITPEGKVVMVEQFRFGIGDLTIEPVAGMISPGEKSLAAAKRELLEETGYGGGEWRYLGAVEPNPATQNNLCHHWLAEGVDVVQAAEPEAGESIRVHLMTLADIQGAIEAGRLRHTLALSVLSRVFPLWETRS
jgi:ADP-ribose pyrophosphatase